jgi:alpha-glucosidase
VPLPWRAAELHAGFGSGQAPWLPQPESFRELARDAQAEQPSSHLNLYRRMLAMRRELDLGRGSLAWLESWCTDTSLAYLNGTTLVVMNVGRDAMELPPGVVLLRSSLAAAETHDGGHQLGSGETVWLNLPLG